VTLIIDKSQHLTSGHPDEHRTHAGQASWAVGPHNCAACRFWGLGVPYRPGGRPCAQFTKLTGRVGSCVPALAASCRYFEGRRRELCVP
jgi:hypothetical protein